MVWAGDADVVHACMPTAHPWSGSAEPDPYIGRAIERRKVHDPVDQTGRSPVSHGPAGSCRYPAALYLHLSGSAAEIPMHH